MRPAGIVLLLGLAAAGCRSYSNQYYVRSADYDLVRRELPGGRVETFRFEGRGQGTLRVTTEYDRERPFLGFQLAELGATEAAQRKLPPHSGLLLRGVYPQSAAAEAGARAGDVLVMLGGKPVVDQPAVFAIERRLGVDENVAATVVRDGERLDLTLVCKRIKERATDQELVPLEIPRLLHRPYAGVTVRGIPAVWCERIWGKPRNAVVIVDLEVGSPAWVAGLRGGDVIEMVDGAPVGTVSEVSALLADRGEAGQTLRLLVRRGDEPPHDAVVQLGDYSGERVVWVPLVFRIEDGTYEDVWTVGPFGLLLGNRNRWVVSGADRTLATRNVFSALLGIVQVTSAPAGSEVRLLWFLRF
ncbi:MAG: PDZ domain-containing protein [Planctomycetota bacterium]